MLTPDLRTDRLVLSCLTQDQVGEQYLGWMSDVAVMQYLEARATTPTIADLRDYVARMRDSTDSYFFGIFDDQTGTHIGNLKLGAIIWVHSTAPLGLVIGERAFWGRGLAAEAIGAVTRWGFDELGLTKLHAGSYARNVGSIRAFERNGFVREGVQRSHVLLDDGSRDDVILLGRLRDEPDGARP